MSKITTCLLGINVAWLLLGCSSKPVDMPLAVLEPQTMVEEPESPVPNSDNASDSTAENASDAAPASDAVPAGDPEASDTPTETAGKLSVATVGGGCFWCTEAVFLRLKGVTAVESGYAGGFVKNPTYEAVCSGATGHAEVVRITFDPATISYDEILKVFWMTHDPTTLNQQGADRGTQYRSVVFFHDKSQQEIATKYKQELDKSGAFPGPIVTEISPLKEYYKAEEYHQNYFERNPFQGYCQAVVRPKVAKFEKVFKDQLKTKP